MIRTPWEGTSQKQFGKLLLIGHYTTSHCVMFKHSFHDSTSSGVEGEGEGWGEGSDRSSAQTKWSAACANANGQAAVGACLQHALRCLLCNITFTMWFEGYLEEAEPLLSSCPIRACLLHLHQARPYPFEQVVSRCAANAVQAVCQWGSLCTASTAPTAMALKPHSPSPESQNLTQHTCICS